MFKRDRLLSEYCTFGIGGPAKQFVEVGEIAHLQEVLRHCFQQGLRYFILGRGSNCLFDDRGFDGVVIRNKINFFEQTDNQFYVGGGYPYARLGALTAKEGWSGLEFASGIPGSVGGAVFMNAGANGRETADALVSVDFLNEKGERETLVREELAFAYRYSPFHERKGAIVGATFLLEKEAGAKQRQMELIGRRTATQPYSDRSAGCIFRNPEGDTAGRLIEVSGLKGYQIGGVCFSEKHGNFIVNKDGGKAEEVLQLIEEAKRRIRADHGKELEVEVRYVPYQEPSQNRFQKPSQNLSQSNSTQISSLSGVAP